MAKPVSMKAIAATIMATSRICRFISVEKVYRSRARVAMSCARGKAHSGERSRPKMRSSSQLRSAKRVSHYMKNHAPTIMKTPAWPRIMVPVTAIAAVLSLWGCPNPNAIGVQQYGSVKATCIQASNGQPVSGAIVTVDGVTAKSTTDASGTVTIDTVAIGTHPITADAPGLHGQDAVTVIENQTVPKQVLMSPT